MATPANAAYIALAAISPRRVSTPLPSNVTVNLADTTQAVNNLPSYTRVDGVTAIAVQNVLNYGGLYLGGFGQIAPLNTIDRNSVIYFTGTLSGDKITANTLTVDRLLAGNSSIYSGLEFGLNVPFFPGSPNGAGVFKASGLGQVAGGFTHTNNGTALFAASTVSAVNQYAAGIFGGGFNTTTGAVQSVAYIGRGTTAGGFENIGAPTAVDLGTASYAIEIRNGTFRYQGTTIQVPSGNPAHTLKGDGTWS